MFIKQLRLQHYFSQEDLAEKSGLSLRTIQRVESGHRVSYASLRALAKAFNIDVDQLEKQLYSKKSLLKKEQGLPLSVRIILKAGWWSASRQEFEKVELFALALSLFSGGYWLSSYIWTFSSDPVPFFDIERADLLGLCGLLALLGSYAFSLTIRIGDKYEIWDKLEVSHNTEIFGLFKNK